MNYASTPQAGPLGLVIIVLLGLAVVLLARSMNRHLKKVPASFDRPEHPPAEKKEP